MSQHLGEGHGGRTAGHGLEQGGEELRWGGVLEINLTMDRKKILEAKALEPSSSAAKWGC